MSEPISRRNALIGAVSVGALANIAAAQQKESGKQDATEKFTINVRLPDGQTISIEGISAKIVFSGGGVLRVLPSGVLPEAPPQDAPQEPPIKGRFPADAESQRRVRPNNRVP